MAVSEARKAYLATWRERNREKLRVYDLAWRRAHGYREGQTWRIERYGTPEERDERRKERVKRYEAEHPEVGKRKAKRYYDKNREARLAATKAWRQTPAGKAWAESYRPKQRESYRRWYAKDPDAARIKKLAAANLRRARMAQAGGYATPEQIRARIDYYGGKCYICKQPWEELDHVIPVSRGGTCWPANLRPACSECNRTKHARPLSAVADRMR